MNEYSFSRQRILVVEDEFITAEAIGRILRRAGAIVVGPVSSVAAALAVLEAEPSLNAAILDVTLGHANVFPLTEALAERGVRYIFATGYDASDLPARYQRIPCCEKPVDQAGLARAFAQMSDHPSRALLRGR